MVGMPGTNGKCTIKLFGSNDCGKLMREGNASKGEKQDGPSESARRPAVRGSYGNHGSVCASVLQVSERSGKFLRS